MTFPPQAFLIGAQRSATTSLAFLLNQHPEITLAEPKEPDFLTRNWDRGLGWYRSCFSKETAILLDASVSYTMAEIVDGNACGPAAERAYQLSPNARFIYIIRDPAERCYSAYWHDVRAGREKRALREAIEQRAYYGRASFYYLQLQSFLKYFSLERILIVSFHEFAQNAPAVASKSARFLGVGSDEVKFTLARPTNQSFSYNRFGQLLRDTVGEGAMKSCARVAETVIPSGLHPIVKRVLRNDVPPVSADDREWLMRWFQKDAVAFERLTGVQVMDH